MGEQEGVSGCGRGGVSGCGRGGVSGCGRGGVSGCGRGGVSGVGSFGVDIRCERGKKAAAQACETWANRDRRDL